MELDNGNWFDAARFGLFVHWGHYATAGWEASWPLVGGVKTLPLGQDVPAATYHANAANFAPVAGRAREWVAAAHAAGMRYAIMGSRHHDGYAMWPSGHGGFGVANAGDVDPVGEFVAACREFGLKIGLYYSLPDWHHPDYPAFTDRHRPYVFGTYPAATPDGWQRYMTYVHGQLDELLTRYGTIDILWFDGGWERSEAEWDTAALEIMIRARQPAILINDRLPGRGDYATPEQFIPPQPPAGRWETCLTMNQSWGFNSSDETYKSATTLIHTVCEVAGRGGNLLLNIGPDGAGRVPPPQADRLAELGEWLARHGAAIYATRPGLEAWQFYGPSTRRGTTVYCHLLMRPVAPIAVRGIPVKHLRGVRALGTETALHFTVRIPVIDDLMEVDGPGEILIDLPEAAIDRHATILVLDFDDEPGSLAA